MNDPEIDIRERMAKLAREQVAVQEKYPDFKLPAEAREEVIRRDQEIVALKAEWDDLQKTKGLFGSATSLDGLLNTPATPITHAGAQPEQKGQGRFNSIGEAVVNDPEWKAWLSGISRDGHIPDRASVKSPPFNLKTLITGDSTTSAGAMVFPDHIPGFYPLGRRPLLLRDVVTNAQTNSDTIEFVKVSSETNNAATVAEATATGDGSGVKPESAVAFVQQTTNVITIAHWIPITRRALGDAGQVRAYIDDFLRDGLNQELEDQMIGGAGGADLVGLTNTTGIQTDASTGNMLALLRRGKRKIQTVGRTLANAYLMNPIDSEAVDLLMDNEARYYFGGPRDVAPMRVWGLPVVEAEAVSTGTAWVGNFKKAILWDREQANIQVSDSHSDFFIRNLIAILAEMRVAFGVVQPNALMRMVTTS